MITKLTPRHEELIVSYQQKWKAVYLSTERINRNQVLNVIEDVFRAYPEGFRKLIYKLSMVKVRQELIYGSI
jgi:hypothetical protein